MFNPNKSQTSPLGGNPFEEASKHTSRKHSNHLKEKDYSDQVLKQHHIMNEDLKDLNWQIKLAKGELKKKHSQCDCL